MVAGLGGVGPQHIGDRLFDGLVQAMLDSATAPTDLARATGPTLVALREEATKRLRERFESEPHQVLAGLEATLPRYLKKAPLPAAALQLGTHRAYFNLPDTIYDARPSIADSSTLHLEHCRRPAQPQPLPRHLQPIWTAQLADAPAARTTFMSAMT